MTVLWMNLALVFGFALLARALATPAPAGPAPYRPDKMMAGLALAALVLVSGLRDNIGDTFFYKHAYETNDIDWAYVLANKDIGFGLYQMALQSISRDAQILIFVTALVTNALVVSSFYRYSRLFEVSLFVYIASGLYMVTMNGMRQCLAGAILFAATKFLLEGRWRPYFAVVALASFFHATAIIMVPIYFLVRRRAWSGASLALLAIAVLIVAGFNQFTSVLFSVIENTQYGEYKHFAEGGSNVVRVAVGSIPLALAFLGRRKLRETMPHGDVFVNMSLLGLVFMLISTQNWIFARFAIYFEFYNIVLLTWALKLFVASQQRLVYYGMILGYLVYYFVENVLVLHTVYQSDFL